MCCFAEFIVKYVLFFTNLVFTLAGAALIGLGIAVLVQFSGATDIIDGSVKLVPVSIIVVGSIIFLIAFFGCCGAIKENCCMLTTYAIFMALLAAVKIWITVVVYNGLGDLDNLVTEWITGAYSEHPNEFNAIESAFECCGTTGAGTYLPGPLPPTCCAPSADTCVQDNAYAGCISVISGFLDDIGSGIGGLIITVIIVEVVAVLFGLCMAFASSKNKQQRGQYA